MEALHDFTAEREIEVYHPIYHGRQTKSTARLPHAPQALAQIACGGLSGGGLRTVFMGGLDPRIKCAVCVGFMTTWQDFLLNKSLKHTWMLYLALIPNELDFPEILGLRVPLPTYVLNDEDDDLYSPVEMRQAERVLHEVYKKAGAEDNLRFSYYRGPHKFDKKMQADGFDWLDKWLKT